MNRSRPTWQRQMATESASWWSVWRRPCRRKVISRLSVCTQARWMEPCALAFNTMALWRHPTPPGSLAVPSSSQPRMDCSLRLIYPGPSTSRPIGSLQPRMALHSHLRRAVIWVSTGLPSSSRNWKTQTTITRMIIASHRRSKTSMRTCSRKVWAQPAPSQSPIRRASRWLCSKPYLVYPQCLHS